ncbi:hypothetical protein GTO27_03725 [Candidatus Bathyarchaeota archaeon]|nr:hypothetical protein [Candidatus Bathyarchaeota archaeon]
MKQKTEVPSDVTKHCKDCPEIGCEGWVIEVTHYWTFYKCSKWTVQTKNKWAWILP